MKSVSPASAFVVRAPTLPFEVLARCREPDDLRRLVRDPVIAEAIFVASPELAENAAAWLAGASDPAIERTLIRYLSRMAGRATPFGLFAGVGVGRFGTTSELRIAPPASHRRHTRLDNDYLFQLCGALSRDPAVRGSLTFFANTSLHRTAGRWRYAESRVDDGARSYQLVAVDASPELDRVLQRVRDGAKLAQLAALLVDDEISHDEALAFVHELVDAQLLVSELQPPVTGTEPSHVLAKQLAALPAGAALAAANQRLAAIDEAPLGAPSSAYLDVARVLEPLPVALKLPRLFQVDLHLGDAPFTLGAQVASEIVRGVELMCATNGEADDPFRSFRDAFEKRYETRTVPLLEVLDQEAGVGFGDPTGPAMAAPLLAGIRLPGQSSIPQIKWPPRLRKLLEIQQRATARGAIEHVLTDADIEVMRARAPMRIPATGGVMCEVAAASADSVDAGEFTVHVYNLNGGSGLRLLGRFCHGSAAITSLARELVEHEQQCEPDVVFAEIVHLPEGRVGNILLRPVLRDHEIAYLGRGGAANQIALDDLDVSLEGSRVVLYSRRLGKEVRPHLASAHNFASGSIPMYRFLCSLAAQYGMGTQWSWGALEEAPFLPRLRHGRVVLSRARWLLQRSELEVLGKAARPHDAVQALRDARRLPRWIAVKDGDNELPVDLENPLMTASLVHLIKGRAGAALVELYPAPDELCARGDGGGYVHELYVPLVQKLEPPMRRPRISADVERRFAPGSRWLFAKLYGGWGNLEVALRDHVRPLVEDVLGVGLAERFFFIRYGDPDSHVRLRFDGDPQRLAAELLPRLAVMWNELIAEGIVWRAQLDTYEREVERYGGAATIELVESIFAADSLSTLAILDAYRGDEGAEAKWRLAVRGSDQLLSDLGLPIADRHHLATQWRDSFGAELGMDTATQKRLGEKYRKHRGELEALLGDTPAMLPDGVSALARRSQQVAPIMAELRRLGAPMGDLAGSLVHMHINRMLSTAHRMQELVIYDLLRRHYESVLARLKQRR